MIAMLAMIIALVFIGYFIERTQFDFLIISGGICFGCFLFLLKNNPFSVSHLLYFSVVCRAIFIFSIPALSDVYFRFFWDGHLTNMGINPFLALPSALTQQNGIRGKEVMQFLYIHMNSRDYFSVYPTIIQGCLSLVPLLSQPSTNAPVLSLHFMMMLPYLGTIFFGCEVLPFVNLP